MASRYRIHVAIDVVKRRGRHHRPRNKVVPQQQLLVDVEFDVSTKETIKKKKVLKNLTESPVTEVEEKEKRNKIEKPIESPVTEVEEKEKLNKIEKLIASPVTEVEEKAKMKKVEILNHGVLGKTVIAQVLKGVGLTYKVKTDGKEALIEAVKEAMGLPGKDSDLTTTMAGDITEIKELLAEGKIVKNQEEKRSWWGKKLSVLWRGERKLEDEDKTAMQKKDEKFDILNKDEENMKEEDNQKCDLPKKEAEQKGVMDAAGESTAESDLGSNGDEDAGATLAHHLSEWWWN